MIPTLLTGLVVGFVSFIAVLLLVGVIGWIAHKLSPYKNL